MTITDIAGTVARLDAWLETMCSPAGYGGPVAHWWRNCLRYTGVGLDWRYEGIVHGYLTLFARTGEDRWLAKAQRAGDDLVRGQLPSGQYASSCFELNPYTGGTPHEAAADLALLALARVLRERNDEGWRVYHRTAERNLRVAQIGQLWDASTGTLNDAPGTPSFVANKAATLAEAILALAAVSDDDERLVNTYALPILRQILDQQVTFGPLRGGIWQNTFGGQRITKLFPFYVARCVPGLVAGYERSHDERFLHGAIEALDFVLRWRSPDGGFPQVVYDDGSISVHPRWIAGVAEITRAMSVLRPYGYEADLEPTLSWLLAAQLPSGAFPTGVGFAGQASGHDAGGPPDFRDLLPVVGWNDKALRFLAGLVPTGAILPSVTSLPYETICRAGRATGTWREEPESLALVSRGRAVYRWEKGADWATVASVEACWA